MKRILASHKRFVAGLLVAAAVAVAPSSAQPPTPPPSSAPAEPTPTTQMPPPTPATSPNATAPPRQVDASTLQSLQLTDENRTMMLTLLDRIQALAGHSLGESKSGKLAIDRATIDEIAADVSQIKAMLQR